MKRRQFLRGLAGSAAVEQFLHPALAFLTPIVSTAEAQQLPNTILVLSQTDSSSPWYYAANASIRSTVRTASGGTVTVHEEYFDLARFSGDRYQQVLLSYIEGKYQDKAISVVLTVGPIVLDIWLQLRVNLRSTLAAAPVVFAAVEQEAGARFQHIANLTGTTYRLTFGTAMAAARAMVPDLKRIALVGDPPHRQVTRRHFGEEFKTYAREVEFIDLMGLPLHDLKRRASQLPDKTVIVYLGIYIDGDGVTYIPRDALEAMAKTANRPIVVDAETHIGYGATGGFVQSPYPVGEEAGRLAMRILKGESASSIPIRHGDFAKLIFDWRELNRWNIDERRLPADSEIRFRQPTFWEQYRREATALAAVAVAQVAAISWLLFERARRRRAEVEARGRLLQLAHMNRAATAGVLSASIAHELNQPLAAILTNTETAELLLKTGRLDIAVFEDILEDIRVADQRAADIIQRLRGLLKQGDFERQSVDLNAVIDDTVTLLGAHAAAEGVSFDWKKTLPAILVQIDRVLLQQVLLNLATNALDAMEGVSTGMRRITFQTALVDARYVEVSVADTGVGIPDAKLKNVFETFFTTKREGMGLGLSIVRTIVEKFGGQIWAEHKTGGGAVFRFTIPLVQDAPLSLG